MIKEVNKEFYDRWKSWAWDKCEKWNWNASIPEIAIQLHGEGVKSDSDEFLVLKDVFNKFFGKDGKPPIISQFEAITQVIENLENN